MRQVLTISTDGTAHVDSQQGSRDMGGFFQRLFGCGDQYLWQWKAMHTYYYGSRYREGEEVYVLRRLIRCLHCTGNSYVAMAQNATTYPYYDQLFRCAGEGEGDRERFSTIVITGVSMHEVLYESRNESLVHRSLPLSCCRCLHRWAWHVCVDSLFTCASQPLSYRCVVRWIKGDAMSP
jgi:hypothetical protein